MICFNCGNILTNSDYCSNCGMDVSVYKKIVRLSNSFYNEGLIKAKNRDLSGAAEILNRSVKLNKRQIDARNLLGLVYFEMGETVQAFREWVISLNIQPDNNGADNYLRAIQSDRNKMNELNHSVRKFNVALTYAQNGTDDMAIIQLKKVLNQNPNMVKAYQLLTVLYMKHGEYEKAKRTVKKSLKIDKCSPLGIHYLRELNHVMEDERKNNPDERSRRLRANRGLDTDREPLSGDDVIVPKNHFKEAFSSAQTILHIVAGLLLGAALVYFIVTPARISSSTEQVQDVKSEYDQKIAIKNSTVSEMQRQVDDLQTQLDQAKSDVEKYKGRDSAQTENFNNLMKAAEYYADEQYTNSVNYLEKIDTGVKMNSEAFDDLLKMLQDNLSDQLSDKYLRDGITAYNSGDIEESVKLFLKCLEVDEENDEACFRLGTIYSQQGDIDKSQEMFQKIVDDMPDSRYYANAKRQVEENE